jgi:hypothetical protein
MSGKNKGDRDLRLSPVWHCGNVGRRQEADVGIFCWRLGRTTLTSGPRNYTSLQLIETPSL